MATSDDLRHLLALFPRDLALHRAKLLAAADELDALHRDMTEAATRIGLQSDLLSRQKNAARRCAEIAREEAKRYDDYRQEVVAIGDLYAANNASISTVACRRIADRIEGEVLT